MNSMNFTIKWYEMWYEMLQNNQVHNSMNENILQYEVV